MNEEALLRRSVHLPVSNTAFEKTMQANANSSGRLCYYSQSHTVADGISQSSGERNFFLSCCLESKTWWKLYNLLPLLYFNCIGG